MKTRNIALIGANSRIGPAILSELLASPLNYQITILLRPTSRPVPSHPRIHPVIVPSDPPTFKDLCAALHNEEALISALNPADYELQMRLADVCVAVGIPRFIPADYGSMRSDDPYVLDILPGFRYKQRIRQHCQRLAEDHPEFTWTSFATGHFFDYGLKTELLGFELDKGKAKLFDGGEDLFSTSTTEQIGRAVVGILANEKKTRNRMLLVQSFCVTQKQILEEVEKVLERKVIRTKVDAKSYLKEQEKLAEGGSAEAIEEIVAVLGIKRSNWTGKPELANELLGLEEEYLATIVKQVLG